MSVPRASAQVDPGAVSGALTSPLHFEASNLSGSPVKYSARTASYSLFLSNEEADVVVYGEALPSGKVTRGKPIVVQAYANVLRMRFVDSNLPTSVGPANAKGRSLPYYTAVTYRGIYPGTDVVVRGDRQRIKFQLNLCPGADADHIVLELAGASEISLDAEGNALARVGRASLILQKPSIVLSSQGAAQRLAGGYRIEARNHLRFVVGAPPTDTQVLTD